MTIPKSWRWPPPDEPLLPEDAAYPLPGFYVFAKRHFFKIAAAVFVLAVSQTWLQAVAITAFAILADKHPRRATDEPAMRAEFMAAARGHVRASSRRRAQIFAAGLAGTVALGLTHFFDLGGVPMLIAYAVMALGVYHWGAWGEEYGRRYQGLSVFTCRSAKRLSRRDHAGYHSLFYSIRPAWVWVSLILTFGVICLFMINLAARFDIYSDFDEKYRSSLIVGGGCFCMLLFLRGFAAFEAVAAQGRQHEDALALQAMPDAGHEERAR